MTNNYSRPKSMTSESPLLSNFSHLLYSPFFFKWWILGFVPANLNITLHVHENVDIKLVNKTTTASLTLFFFPVYYWLDISSNRGKRPALFHRKNLNATTTFKRYCFMMQRRRFNQKRLGKVFSMLQLRTQVVKIRLNA